VHCILKTFQSFRCERFYVYNDLIMSVIDDVFLVLTVIDQTSSRTTAASRKIPFSISLVS
ncbi:hypothetical protein THOM_1534, partial [Trachipleistophora hominis]